MFNEPSRHLTVQSLQYNKTLEQLRNIYKVNKKDSRTISLYVFPVSLLVVFKHIAHLALPFLLWSLSR